MKKTAKQMFEELGWERAKLEEIGEEIIYKKTKSQIKRQRHISRIRFFKYEKYNIHISGEYYTEVYDKEINGFKEICKTAGVVIGPLELQAINKQVEELGWREKENE